MPIADDWNINYNTKQIYHAQWKDEINGSSSSVAQVQTFVAQAASTITTGDYFYLYSARDDTPYYVWYNKGGGGGDPTPTGFTAIEVTIGGSDTDVQVATATVTAVSNANYGKDFTATNVSGTSATVTITNKNKGSCTNASDENTGFTSFTVTTNGIGETVFSANALYSYLQDTFDELGQMDDAVPMSAQTPTDYTIINEWFIDEVSIKYLSGGAIKTSGWLHVDDSNAGIVQVTYSSAATAPDENDFGQTVTSDSGDLDTGTLLFADTTRSLLWIRPDTTAATDTFDTASAGLTCSSGMDVTQNGSAATSGENLWANVYTLGTIQTDPYPQVYIFQNGSSISEWSSLTNWDRGQIDVLIRVKEMGTEIDGANITVFARQGGNSYDHFSIDLTSGGRNAVPLSTATDLNYTTGDYYLLYNTEASGPFNANEVIQETDASYVLNASGWSAQIVSVTDWGTTGLLKLTNVKKDSSDTFPQNTDYFKAISSTATGATARVNGTLGDTYVTYDAEGGTAPSVGTSVEGSVSTARRIIRGIQDDGTTGKLVLQVDTTITGSNRDVYYISFADNDNIRDIGTPANYYTADSASTTIVSGWDDITVAFVNGTVTYSGTTSGTFTPGEKVTWSGGTESAIILEDDTDTKTITLGNCTSTSLNGATLTGQLSAASNSTVNQNLQSAHTMTKNFTQQSAFPYDIIINAGDIYNTGRSLANVYEYLKFITQENSTFSMYTVVSSVITVLDGEEYIQAYTGYTPVKSAPFGTFAGGTLFGAQGVWIEGMASGQSYQYIDSNGTTRTPYASITISVTQVVSGDRVTVFRTSSGLVDKDLYQSHATNNAAGDTTIETDGTPDIATDTPDSGVIRVVDASENTEHRFRYSSWTQSTNPDPDIFTLTDLSSQGGSVTSGDVTGTTLTDTGAAFTTGVPVLPGDLIRNETDGSWAHAITVSATSITHTPLQGGSENDWDTSDTYSFNNLPVTYTSSDTIYVPFIDETASSTSVSKTVLYDSTRTVLVRVRKKGILPFETSGSVTSSGLSVAAIRTTDSIVT